MSEITIIPLTPDTPTFPTLLAQSLAEGHRMLARFEQNWRSGANRFDRPGELVLGAIAHGTLLGMCGRNIDPYDATPGAGRVRHLYVTPQARRLGLGRLLIETICADAATHFEYLNTNAPPDAFGFYERLGFSSLPGIAHVTHRRRLA
ncbi:GNAT family N-acetyltransferase [uncultured Devosia sp.]|uniref:GNAT family N-acetyltransferase n=1 Tax=uncultured Devosia sp. TaxID=211434 RepID=UPI0035CA4BDB